MPRLSRRAERDAWTAAILGEPPKQRGKYQNAAKEDAGGYDSKLEMDTATNLHALASSGQIRDLKEKPCFELIPADPPFTACRYFADFSYIDADGTLHVIDSKGVKTQVYLLKKKLMWHVHRIKIEEIHGPKKAKRRSFLHRLPH